MWHKDIQHALRALKNNPAFTAVAVLSLALGIGANSAIYSLAHALLLRPLPVPDPSGLVVLQGTRSAEQDPQEISHPDFLDLRQQTQSFHSLIATQDIMLGFAARPADTAQMKLGAFVSGNFFDEIGVSLALGRPFRPDEDEVPGRNPVAVISHELWIDQYQSDPAILSRKIRLNNVELAIIGVAPANFSGLRNMIRASFYVPIYMSSAIIPTRAIPGRRDIFPLWDSACHQVRIAQSPAALFGVNTAVPALPRSHASRPARRSACCADFHWESEINCVPWGSQLASSNDPIICSVTETRYQSAEVLWLARRSSASPRNPMLSETGAACQHEPRKRDVPTTC